MRIFYSNFRSYQHDFYFGLNKKLVQNADLDTNEYQGRYLGLQNMFKVNETVVQAKPAGPYYWRVDATDRLGNVFKGNVWSFSFAG